jgi:hypothetical protein
VWWVFVHLYSVLLPLVACTCMQHGAGLLELLQAVNDGRAFNDVTAAAVDICQQQCSPHG